MKRSRLVAAMLVMLAGLSFATVPGDGSAEQFARDLARQEIARLVLELAKAPERKKATIRNQIDAQQAILRTLASE